MAQRNNEAITRQSTRTSKVISFPPMPNFLFSSTGTVRGPWTDRFIFFLDKNKLYYLLYRQRYYWTICYLWLSFRLLLQFWIHKGQDFNSDLQKPGHRASRPSYLTVRPVLLDVFHCIQYDNVDFVAEIPKQGRRSRCCSSRKFIESCRWRQKWRYINWSFICFQSHCSTYRDRSNNDHITVLTCFGVS